MCLVCFNKAGFLRHHLANLLSRHFQESGAACNTRSPLHQLLSVVGDILLLASTQLEGINHLFTAFLGCCHPLPQRDTALADFCNATIHVATTKPHLFIYLFFSRTDILLILTSLLVLTHNSPSALSAINDARKLIPASQQRRIFLHIKLSLRL